MNHYIATYDDGHDYGSFEFTSDHRAGSQANKEDARGEAMRKYGYKRGKAITFTSIYKIDY